MSRKQLERARRVVVALALLGVCACPTVDPATPEEVRPPVPPPRIEPETPSATGEGSDAVDRDIALVPLEHADAHDVVAMLSERIAPLIDPSGRVPDGVRLRADVRPDDRVNRVVISAPRAELDDLRALIAELDRAAAPPDEVVE